MYPSLTVPGLGLTLRSADVMIQLAVVLCVLVGPIWAARLEGLDARRVRRALVVLAVITLVGGRIHFLLNYWRMYSAHPLAALKIWTGGFHVGGGILAFALAAPWVTRRFGLPLGKFADGIVPSLGLAIVIARLGCFMQGCCFGAPCDHAWCLRFPAVADVFLRHLDIGLVHTGDLYAKPVHPLQLYFAASGLLVTGLTLALRPLRRYPGNMALIGLFVFATTTSTLEFLRDTLDRVYWGPLTQLTWTALAMMLAALIVLVMADWRRAGSASAA